MANKSKYFYNGIVKVIPKKGEGAFHLFKSFKKGAEICASEDFEMKLNTNYRISESGILETRFQGSAEVPLKENVDDLFWSMFRNMWGETYMEHLENLQSNDFNIIFEFSEYKQDGKDFTTNTEIVNHKKDNPLCDFKVWEHQSSTKELSLLDLMDRFDLSLDEALNTLGFEPKKSPSYQQTCQVLDLVRNYSWLNKCYTDTIRDAEVALSNLSANFSWYLQSIRKNTKLSIKDNISVLSAIEIIKKVLEEFDLDSEEPEQQMPSWVVLPYESFWVKANEHLGAAVAQTRAYLRAIDDERVQEWLSFEQKIFYEEYSTDTEPGAGVFEKILKEILKTLESILGKEVDE